ncbi:hypothetical protein GIB67_011587 [Kingdonia uniflora]|uniref:Uncharacterized protein n=1 Tax=Kingdonia uniflora TaxID=39325 RepID=A0A7J7NMM2_9MAGN|nr:hypothetical protein GIB67_011587 [Kingdonia uniflora]
MNEKVPSTAYNRRKRELAREGDLLTYKRKRKTIDPSTVVIPNTVDTANEGVSEPVPPTESAQAALGAQAEFAQAILECKDLEEKNCKKSESLKMVNTLLMEQIDLHLPPATPPMPDAALTKKYDDLLSVHEDVKKKLIAKEDFIMNWTSKYKKEAAKCIKETNHLRKKLVNTEKRMKSLEVNNSEWHNKLVNSEERKKTLEVDNSEWEVWRQALKKALASEGMGDMGDPTFKKKIEQNERFFIIAQQGPKGDYQEDLVSTAVTLKNVIIARREKMAKKKKIQELLLQPWIKYLVDVRGVEISDNNSSFRVTVAYFYDHQHVEYRHMAHLLSTYYEKFVVFITLTEAYTFLPLFWARKRNTTSNEERFQNLLMDTSKYWWLGLGADNHYVRLFPRFDAPIHLVSTLFYGHANLEIPLAFVKEQLTRYFDVRVKIFKALLREHNVKVYRVNDMVVAGLSTIK